MHFALYNVAKNNRTSVTLQVLEFENNMLFELVEIVCFCIIKGELMKLVKIYGIFTTICPHRLWAIVQSSVQASAIKWAQPFQTSYRFSFQLSFFIFKKWP